MAVVFVLLFAYVFGSAIDIPGISYREFRPRARGKVARAAPARQTVAPRGSRSGS